MVNVRFTRHLVRFFPGLERTEVEGSTVAEVIGALDTKYPGLADYIVDERGTLRRHVNIFVSQEMIHDRQTLSDPVQDGDEMYVFQALSGGSSIK
ncbi:MAG: MoaD/ThiS family protein [Candidatus Promineifilaceae bacterium]|nr:MoaD/ThiS family protein [Candidatus Promineifilaceae bacterium]